MKRIGPCFVSGLSKPTVWGSSQWSINEPAADRIYHKAGGGCSTIPPSCSLCCCTVCFKHCRGDEMLLHRTPTVDADSRGLLMSDKVQYRRALQGEKASVPLKWQRSLRHFSTFVFTCVCPCPPCILHCGCFPIFPRFALTPSLCGSPVSAFCTCESVSPFVLHPRCPLSCCPHLSLCFCPFSCLYVDSWSFFSPACLW